MQSTEKRIDELQKILEVTKLLNSSDDVDYILNYLMQETLRILERADIGVIFLYNVAKDILELKTSIGFGNIKMVLKPGESITGAAFSMKKTLHLKSHEEMMFYMGTMEKTKFSLLNEKISLPMHTIQSSISCPLIHNDICLGVFVIDNYMNKEALNEDDVYLAELISQHATIALSNAENRKKEIENKKSLQKYSRLVESEKDRYKYSTYLHNKFTEMVLNGRSINDVLKEVSIMLKKDVFILDLFNVITNYSLGFTTNIDMLKLEKSKFVTKIHEHKESLFYCENLFSWILFNPITVNKEILGWVGILTEASEIDELEKITIDKCSTILALEKLKNSELSNMEQSLKGNFLDNLLEDTSNEFANKFAEKYNYNFNNQHQILIVRIDANNIEMSLHQNIKYLYNEINKLAIQAFSNSITLINKNYIITIFDYTEKINRSKLLSFIREIDEKRKYVLSFSKIKFNCQISVSSVIKNSSDFKITYNQTMHLFNLEINENKNFDYYFYDDLEIKKLLLKNDKEDLDRFVNKTLGPLLNYRNTSRDDLFETLTTYVTTGGNWTTSKNKLHIHGNTLTYRINRIQEILGYDLSEYAERFKIQIALEIIESNKIFRS